MDQGSVKSGNIQRDVLDPFPGSGMANGGRHRAQKWSKNAINGHFVAISRPAGSEMVDQRGSRFDLVWSCLGQCVGTFFHIQNGHHDPKGPKKRPKGHKKDFLNHMAAAPPNGHSRPG